MTKTAAELSRLFDDACEDAEDQQVGKLAYDDVHRIAQKIATENGVKVTLDDDYEPTWHGAAKDAWLICTVCDGDGTTVNPAIDGNGLSAEDFHEDPDFAEDYMSGVYDISCRACGGSGKLKQSRLDELARNAADRRLAAREDGDYEAYCHASDYRYG